MSVRYRTPILENFEFQPSVLDKDLTTSPTPVEGNRYIMAGTGGSWSTGAINDIAWYEGATWHFDIPKIGTIVYVVDESKFYVYGGSSWALLTTVVDWSAITNKPSSSVADIDSAVSLKHSNSLDHTHSNITVLNAIQEAFTTALKSSYDDAVSNSHTHSNKTTLDAIEQALTTTLKSNYDTAYSSRATYNEILGCITFTI